MARMEYPPHPEYPDIFDDNYWNDGLDSSTNEVDPNKAKPKLPSLDNIKQWMQDNLLDKALVGILDHISKNPYVDALSKSGAFAMGDWAIKYAHGDWSPITKSPGPVFNQVVKVLHSMMIWYKQFTQLSFTVSRSIHNPWAA